MWSRQVIADIYVPELWGHHAYLSIESDSEIIVGFGFWEKVGVNNSPNLPVSKEKRQDQLPKRIVTEEKYCQYIEEDQIGNILKEARAYPEAHGKYHKYFNNCVEFAEYFYERYTSGSIPPLLNSPYLLHVWIKASKTPMQGGS